MNTIEQLRDDIAANRVPGGSAFARAGAELIALTLEQDSASGDADAARITAELADWLTDVKPSMAVVRNMAQLARAAADAADGASVRDRVAGAMRTYIERSQAAVAQLANYASVVIPPGARVLVHSYSASMLAVLMQAAGRPGGFQLAVTESRPYRESRRLVEALRDTDVPITLFSDAAVAIAVADCDLALVGADSVLRDGSFANKTGSLPLALACARFGKPLYVATEVAKLYTGDPDDVAMELRPAEELAEGWDAFESGRVRVQNQFFERVGAEFVTSYVTEYGLVAPSEMPMLGAAPVTP